MAFQRFAPTRRVVKNELVVGVGSRAFVNWHPPGGTVAGGVPMLDSTGARMANDLRDGEEQEDQNEEAHGRRLYRSDGRGSSVRGPRRRGCPTPATAAAGPPRNDRW